MVELTQALVHPQAVAPQLRLGVDGDGSGAVGLAVVQVEVVILVTGRLVFLLLSFLTEIIDLKARPFFN